ncbi:hypothetical protein ACO1O0_005227 [Amphichorda felina]
MADISTPTKRCHNCRRQRLRCDRSYPHCNKCLLAGKECLGYGQLFRWTGAIASRGKLAGKTSSADVSAVPSTSPNESKDHRTSKVKEARKDDRRPARSRSSSPQTPAPVAFVAEDHSRAQDRDSREMVRRSETPDAEFSSPWVLADPLVQDLSYSYRHYLSYFANRVCRDLVSHDVPDRNPFRGLLTLTTGNPLLQHIIVAASAAHMSNLIRPSLPPLVEPNLQVVSPTSSADSRRAWEDALVAKHKALRLMHNAVQNIDSVGVDVVLAASLFFVNVELIESGKHGWKAHLEGAGKIMSLLGPAEGTVRDLRDYMLSDCFSYFVLASAFTPSTSTVQSYFQSSQIPLILGRATANSYLCCPPTVMEIIYAAAQLSNVKVEDDESAAQVAIAGMSLLRRIEDIDVRTWAADALNLPYLSQIALESRINAGLAHRLAARLYIVHAIEPVRKIFGQEGADALDQALFEQLSKIPPDDPNFKATTWPTFLSGAGAKDTHRRAWVMERLQKHLGTCPWGFLYTAMETLQVLWRLDGPERADKTWVQTLKDPKLNFLMKARVSYGVSDLEMDFLGHFQPACDLVTKVALVPL